MAAKNSELKLEERYEIEEYAKQNLAVREIARRIKRCHSCVTIELDRNGGKCNYNALKAHNDYLARLEMRGSKLLKDISEKQIQEIYKLHDEGNSMNEIARVAGLSKGVVVRLILTRGKDVKKPYKSIDERVSILEEQIKILFETLRSK